MEEKDKNLEQSNQQNIQHTPKAISDGAKRFFKATKPDYEPVVMVLKCHLLAEYHLDQLIIAALERGDVITNDERGFMFSHKLKVVEALNILNREIIDSLKKLNALRNSCSHEQEYEIMEGDIERIGRPFGKTFLKIKKNNPERKDLLTNTLMLLIARLDYGVETYIEDKLNKSI